MILKYVNNGRTTGIYVDDLFIRDNCSSSYCRGFEDALRLAHIKFKVENYFCRGEYPHKFGQIKNPVKQ